MTRPAISLALAFALLALAANGVIALVNTQASASYQKEVIHTTSVLNTLQSLLTLVDDAETGQRGYIITGNPAYLQPYRHAVKRLHPRILLLARQTSDNPLQRGRVGPLTKLVNAKLAELRRTVQLRAVGRYAQAVRLILSNRGQVLMRRIRASVYAMEGEERNLLARRSSAASDSEQRAVVTILIGAAANAGLLLFVFYVLSRWLRRRDQYVRDREAVLARERTLRLDVERIAAEREAILTQIADAVLVANSEGRVVFANDAASTMLNLRQGESIDGVAYDLPVTVPAGADTEEGHTVLGEILTTDAHINGVEIQLPRDDAGEIVLQGSVAPVIRPSGAPLGAVAVFRDITVQRVLERDKENFLSSAAHDLKTPLAAIKGVAQLMQRRLKRMNLDGSESVIEGLERIDATATRMAGLVTEMLDITRLEMGRPIELVKEPADLLAVIRTQVQEMQARQPKHRISLSLPKGELVASIDVPRLQRVLDNILSNAIKYSPAGGDVDVQVGTVEDVGERWARITVVDRGVGIPDEDLPRMFERFHRGSNVSGTIPGTGLGLAAARQLVEQHGGRIGLESVEGRGTSVVIDLPLHSRVSAEAAH